MAPSSVLDREYRSDANTLHTVRQESRRWLEERGAGEDQLERAALIVSELAANAVQACPGAWYHLHVGAYADGTFAIAISNRTRGTLPTPPQAWPHVSPLAGRGRGLMIVEALSASVSVDLRGNRVTVIAHLAAEGPSAPVS